MATLASTPLEKVKAAVPVVLVHVLLAFLILNIAPPLWNGVIDRPDPLQILPDDAPRPEPIVTLPPPQPVRPDTDPRRIADPEPEGGAAPPNIRSTPTPIVAPDRIVQPPVQTPITAAQNPGTGFDRSAGAAEVPGPGTGAGGFGDGAGSGRGGDGSGGGGGSRGGFTRPRHISGALSIRDLPEALAEAGIEGTVGVRYAVQPDGNVTDCIIEESSGNRALDALTCRLIEQRFRFRPSLDPSGRPIRSQIVENHTWEVDRLPQERREERRRRRFPF